MSEMMQQQAGARLQRLFAQGRDSDAARARVDLEPGSVYEVLTRQMVDDMRGELVAVRQRIDALFYVVVAAIAGNLIIRILGA